jgi:hypothetical protein
MPEQIKDICLECDEAFEAVVGEIRKAAKAEELQAITTLLADRQGTMRGKQIPLKNPS